MGSERLISKLLLNMLLLFIYSWLRIRNSTASLYLIRIQSMKFIVLLISIFISGYVYSDENCMTSSQVEAQIEKRLQDAAFAFEVKYGFKSDIEQLEMLGAIRSELDPVHSANLIRELDRLSNTIMRSLETMVTLTLVDNYELEFKRDMERTLAMHYDTREKYESVEGDMELINLSKAVGYSNASQND